jgi:site-specific DNA recombinase
MRSGKDDHVPTCAIYCRVSSQEQQRRGTIESQRRVLTDLARTLGHPVFATYEDDGKSAKAGSLEARDAFARMLVDAEAKRFELVLVVDIDRLTRTDDMIERAAILGPLQRANVQIVTPHGPLDLRTFIGDVLVTLHAAVAAQERKKIMERTRQGRRTAMLRGEKPHGHPPYGLTYSKDKGWGVDEERAAIVREIHHRIGAGETCIAIAVDLNRRGVIPPRPATFIGAPEWNRQVVWRLVRHSRNRYMGTWLANKTDGFTMPVPALVTEEEIEAVDAVLRDHRRRGLEHRTTAVYLLDRGLLRCKKCGSTVGVQTARADPRTPQYPVYATYVCRRRYGLPKGHPDRCDLRTVRTVDLDRQLWGELQDIILSPAFFRIAMERRRQWMTLGQLGMEAQAAKARSEIERLRKVEATIMDAGIVGRIPADALSGRLAVIASEVARHEETLRSASKGPTAPKVSEEEIAEAIESLRMRVASAEGKERRTIARKVVGRAIFNGAALRVGILPPVSAVSWTTERRSPVTRLTMLVRRSA